MKTTIRNFLWGCIAAGTAFGVVIGLLARDPGMVQGALVAGVTGALITPFVARLWG